MHSLSEFEYQLMALDPAKVEFPRDIDQLLESVPSDLHEKLIPAIFRFFEKFPLEDCGAPGSLVHLIEHFYPKYKSILLESLHHAPSYNAILMAHRILNSQLAQSERDEYMAALREVSSKQSIHPALIEHAKHFIEYQQRRHG